MCVYLYTHMQAHVKGIGRNTHTCNPTYGAWGGVHLLPFLRGLHEADSRGAVEQGEQKPIAVAAEHEGILFKTCVYAPYEAVSTPTSFCY